MSLSAAVLDALVAAGATQKQLVAVMKADIADRERVEVEKLEKKREGNRARQQRKRARNAKSRVTAVTERDARDHPPNERDNLTPREVSEAEASSPQPWALPAGVSLLVWTDFLSNRKRKRLGNTPTAWKSFLADLGRVSSQTGIPPPQLIERCTAKGWGAIYDPREQRSERSLSGTRPGDPDGLSSTARAAIAVFGSPNPRGR